eukprot:6195810-Pleurochrysis_carterae.AAC.2
MDVQLNGAQFHPQQHVRDSLIGLALLLLTDTYYQCGYVNGSMLPELLGFAREKGANWAIRRLGDLLMHARVLLALCGSVMLWNGLYNLLYWTPHEDWLRVRLSQNSVIPARGIKSAGCVVIGLVLLIASGTLLEVSRVPVSFGGQVRMCQCTHTPSTSGTLAA